ncbi:peptidase M16 inactive domain protein [bacterium BMS3Abin03]|nr:peptidase M16 inactive domain protein [bacterium BMS3Abin03]
MKLNRTIKPAPSKDLNFVMPSVESFELDNKLKVYFIKKDTLPIVRLNIIINAGNKFDPENKKGLSNLLSMCIDEGAGEFDALQLSEQFDLIGAQFSVYSNSDTLQLIVQTLTENFGRAIELLSMILIDPHLHKNDFEREKRKIITRLKQLQDEPEFLANAALQKYLLGSNNPYSYPTIGKIDNITKITDEDVVSFYNSTVKPGNTFMVVAGAISTEELKDNLSRNFNNWSNTEFRLNISIGTNKDLRKVYVINKKDSVQTEIRVGHHTSGRGSKDYFNKQILNTILGGQFTSRINLNLREKHGYTYGAGSSFNYYKESAYFSVSTSVGIENTANALKEIMFELERIREGVTPEELDFAKDSIIRKFPLNFETYRQVASNFIGKVIFDLPDDYFDTYIDNIKAVILEGVNEAAVKYIKPDVVSIILVGDKDKLKKQLSTDGFGDVIFTELEL